MAALTLLLTSAVVSAQSSATLSGFEIYATSTDGQFVGGVQGGPLAGGFYANVEHQALPTSTDGTAAICGITSDSADSAQSGCPTSGSAATSTVTVYLASGGSVTGEFAYNSKGISYFANTGSCATTGLFHTFTQTYAVDDTVAFGGSDYEFAVTLTHYLINLGPFGGCQTFSAAISGTLAPS